MGKAKARSDNLLNVQAKGLDKLGYVGFLVNEEEQIISDFVYLNSYQDDNKYYFADNVDGVSFLVEEGTYIEDFVIKSLILNSEVLRFEIEDEAEEDSILSVKNVYVEVLL